MKILGFILAITFQTFFSVALAQTGEVLKNDYVRDIFAEKIADQLDKTFIENIERFNDANHTVESILETIEDPTDQVTDYMDNQGELPKIEVDEDLWAIINIQNHQLRFNSLTLYEGYVLFDDKKLKISKLSPRNAEKAFLSQNSSINTILDFFISRAHAVNRNLEIKIISTAIAVYNDFESSWCMNPLSRKKCLSDKAKDNFNLVMEEIEYEALMCERNSSYIPSEIGNSSIQYQSSLKLRLYTYFDSDDEKELTCQAFVERHFQDDVREKYRNNRNNNSNGTRLTPLERLDAFTKEYCDPINRLQNCLLDKDMNSRSVYNEGRNPHQRINNLPSQYQISPRDGNAEQR